MRNKKKTDTKFRDEPILVKHEKRAHTLHLDIMTDMRKHTLNCRKRYKNVYNSKRAL